MTNPKSTSGVEPEQNQGCSLAADRRRRARTSMGAEGLEPPVVSWRLQIYSLAQSPLCHTPATRSIASYGTRTRSNTSTGCHANPYTNETSQTGVTDRA